MDAVEAVARALYERHCAVMFPDEPINWGRGGYATQVMEWQALARAALSAARPFVAAEWQERADDAVKAAFIAGATAVHDYWAAGGTAREADFGEAAGDYLNAIKETIR